MLEGVNRVTSVLRQGEFIYQILSQYLKRLQRKIKNTEF